MYIVIITSFLALLLTYLDSKKNLVGGMKWGFIFLAFLGCIHYDYGNDYMPYYQSFKDLDGCLFDFYSFLDGTYKEPGWVFLSYLFMHLGGFFMMVAVLNIVQNILVYKVICRYVDKSWWPMSVFIYAFFMPLYLMSFSMMRQSLVICIFLGIWPLIEQRKWLRALIILYLCSTIHTSALILIPFAFWGFIPLRRTNIWAIFLGLFYILIMLGESIINNVFSMFLTIDSFGEYAETYGDYNDKSTYGIGYLLNQVPFLLSLYYLLTCSNKVGKQKKSVVMLSLISFIIIPFTSIIPLIGRVGMYFISYQMIALPIIYSHIKDLTARNIAMFLLVFVTFYDYIHFFQSPIWIKHYTIFKTIFSVL